MLIKMADTFERATNKKHTVGLIRNFSDEFANKLELKNASLR
jgi:hypothetical protein